ncbi:MAG: Fur family transcriptional regulator [Planctomycetota bacterium]
MSPTPEHRLVDQLSQHGIRPSAQRVAIARYVLATDDHPTAEQVWSRVRATFPTVSRATVYNTLQLFKQHGLLLEHELGGGSAVFDPNVEPHHHFVDDETGEIRDIPWSAIPIGDVNLPHVQVREYSVVVRGRRADAP